MAAPILPLPQVKLPSTPSTRLTPEQIYWRSFKSPLLIPSPSNNSINHISQPSAPASASAFSSIASPPDVFAVSTGARVQLYSIRTRKLVKTLTRFDDIARGADIRPDGRILVAGDDSGTIQTFDANSRAILKTWKEHKQPVWVTRFSPSEPTTLLSASDDRTVRLWDLPSESSVRTFTGHTDYVRSGLFLPGAQSTNMLLSGSYDGTVRLWDSRAQGRSVLTFKMPAPIENILSLPSGTTVLAAAENQIAVLDVVAGRPLQTIQSHQKTVTSLSLASKGERVVSGALDGHLKVFETTGWNVVAATKYPSPILSLAVLSSGVDQEDKHLAVGMQSGLLSIRTRMSGQQLVKERERKREMQALLEGRIEEHDRLVAKKQRRAARGRGWEKRLRGVDFVGEGVDVVIETHPDGHKKRKEATWEQDLRKGRYYAALDAALAKQDKIAIITLLTALRHRSALRSALSNRDEITLQPIMKWVYQHITDPRLVEVCVEVAMNILDIYSGELGQSTVVDGLIEKLRRRVTEEVDKSQQAWTTRGMLEFLRIC
ncbi:WD40 repeat-like-containing domain protein [Ascosphaera apis ARSEF 7405]|uniref:WD40 repeat-like-containing domain protein n=1 Tax=Ascosphaera apis ARSEF 7405 TaxID=392613 RepID=A0A167UTF3_9EURO|nr:WD40 repeat-like-containing domain protein [Ascosphaera apis ARSEF 7405]